MHSPVIPAKLVPYLIRERESIIFITCFMGIGVPPYNNVPSTLPSPLMGFILKTHPEGEGHKGEGVIKRDKRKILP
ncbi:MAG: hypothetical protein A2Y90_01345 [Chloroflexi bacterium RBG_13_52_12]|nr:MAG: hypothetical protein A2Y90_01345 [Chloroflexi bacterium RBG_13_52_12]